MGVRPEDVELVRGEELGLMSGMVSGVQWLGPHTIVEMKVSGMEGADWKARVSGKAEFRVGEKVGVRVAEKKKMWFDESTGKRKRE